MQYYSDVADLHGKKVVCIIDGGTIHGTFYMGAGCGDVENYGLHFNLGLPTGKTGRRYTPIAENMDAMKFDVMGDNGNGEIILLHK